jgi:hypothetical protein
MASDTADSSVARRATYFVEAVASPAFGVLR